MQHGITVSCGTAICQLQKIRMVFSVQYFILFILKAGKKFPRDDPIPFSSSSCILDQAVLSDTDGVPGACGDSDDIFPLLHLTLAVGIVSAGCHCTVSSYSCRVSIPAGDADDILPGSGFALSVPVAADCQYGAVLFTAGYMIRSTGDLSYVAPIVGAKFFFLKFSCDQNSPVFSKAGDNSCPD